MIGSIIPRVVLNVSFVSTDWCNIHKLVYLLETVSSHQVVVMHTFNPRQADLCEFEASLVYTKFQDSQDYTEKPCL